MEELNKSTKHIIIEKIIVKAEKGGAIGSCIREAIMIANQCWVNVELIHNDITYMIYVNDLISIAKRTEHITKR